MVRSSTKENPAEFPPQDTDREKEREKNKGSRYKECSTTLFSWDKLVGMMEREQREDRCQGKKEKIEKEECGRNIAAFVQ